MCGALHFPDGLHQSVAHYDADVGTRVALGLLAQRDEVGLVQAVGRGAQMQLKHEGAGVFLWQGDVDALLKSTQTHTHTQCSGVQIHTVCGLFEK